MPRMCAMYTKITWEYNILWFVVDMHHRERYFFICGPEQIVVKSGLRSRFRGSARVRRIYSGFTFRFRLNARDFRRPSQAELTPAE